ncbi:MAG TPA: hypothetical protein VFB38_05820 [Chthonomonadaceae bacterium]|nr:hypothetical protein [Chthonomonadaceae bacterium]
MTQHAGRLTCPRCGANNFSTVTACWKCSAPLNAAGNPSASAAAPAYPPTPSVERAAMAPVTYAPATADGDPGVARRAAIALALLIPWIGLPVGWIFMMIEDSRKQAVGRICVLWSTIALIFHLFLMYALAAQMVPYLQMALGITRNTLQNGGKGGGLGGDLEGGGIR